MRSMRLLLLPLATIALLAGCRDDPVPDKSKKPDSPVGDTQLRDTIQRPIQRAKGVEQTIQAAKDKDDSRLQEEENGNPNTSPP